MVIEKIIASYFCKKMKNRLLQSQYITYKVYCIGMQKILQEPVSTLQLKLWSSVMTMLCSNIGAHIYQASQSGKLSPY